jgi:hypothetical protein
MPTPIPPHLQSTVELLKKTFPQGVGPDLYYPVIYVLQEGLGDRNLAIVAEWLSPASEGLNDVYRMRCLLNSIHENDPAMYDYILNLPASFTLEDVASVRAKLMENGLAEWLACV